jgi:hypothetical protein
VAELFPVLFVVRWRLCTVQTEPAQFAMAPHHSVFQNEDKRFALQNRSQAVQFERLRAEIGDSR